MNYYKEDLQFYPTPKSFLEKICKEFDWMKITNVLEPSAGKGDIADFMKEEVNTPYERYDVQIDCIEKDEHLRELLKGKGYHVIHDDFLSYNGRFHYDLIFMNPPFAAGEHHLMKALQIQKHGGMIVCILNAATIENPCTNLRKTLIRELEEYQADIQFYEESFTSEDCERKSNVRVAVVKVNIPEPEYDSTIYTRLKRHKFYESDIDMEITDPAVNDLVKSVVQQYELEVDAGLQLIREYKGMEKYILSDVKDNTYSRPTITLKVGDEECSENRYILLVREKYWNALFRDPRFTQNMTSNQCETYLSQVKTLINYDFSYSNIKEIQIDMTKNLIKGIEDCIIKLFDECSNKHSWYPECEKNLHYYNGWARNKAWIINEKIILPITVFYKNYNNKMEISTASYRSYNVEMLYDIEKVFNYLGGRPQILNDCSRVLTNMELTGDTKNVKFKYFTATFYKKGTCHITFTDTETLKKFNVFGSKQKGWLPPSYGKKRYSDMEEEEKRVVDEFQGQEDYDHILVHADQYIYDPKTSIPKLTDFQ